MSTEWGRIYFLNVSAQCEQSCSFCAAMGCLSQKQRAVTDVQRSLLKAKSSGYDSVLVSCSEASKDGLLNLMKDIRNANLRPILQLEVGQLLNFSKKIEQLSLADQEFLRNECSLLMLAGQKQGSWLENARAVMSYFQSFHLQIIFMNNFESLQILREIKRDAPEFIARLVFAAPNFATLSGGDYDLRYLRLLVSETCKELNLAKPPMLQGLDAFNAAINHFSELESLESAEILAGDRTLTAPRISVVIPTYNNKNYLLCTVRHLLAQDLSASDYEIVIVDDGSEDGTRAALMSELGITSREQKEDAAKPQPVIQYFYFARNQKRQMGDSQFRAGVARNQGVRLARGEYLLFLDSDIVTPPDYLRGLLAKHQSYDVVQAVRLHLKPEVSHLATNFFEINDEADLLTVEEGYWDAFHAIEDWDSLKDKWKYVCTYAISMPRELFCRVGWFRKNYCVYGYEDTDLGYRLAQSGARFYLNKAKTYHLHHSTVRSEFQNSFLRKKLLLRHSALVFYLNTLCEDVYSHLQWVLSPHLKLRLYTYELLVRLYKIWLILPGSRFVEKQMRLIVRVFNLKKYVMCMLWPARKIVWFIDYQIASRFHKQFSFLKGRS